jgi:hypothetical protein
MKKLIALLAAAGAALFFWRKHKKDEPAWGTADAGSSMGESSGETGGAGTESSAGETESTES